MKTAHFRKNLVVLVADKQMEFAVKGLLNRSQALQIRAIQYEIYQHPLRDSGCRFRSAVFLQPFVNLYDRALVMFDKKGCGQEEKTRIELEKAVEDDLSASGWDDRAAVIVIDPELENWVWADSPHVDFVLGWQAKKPNLRSWLQTQGFLQMGQSKPFSPKKAMKEALRIAQKAQSAAIFYELAQRASIKQCSDPAFLKFKAILAEWFAV